jgi:AcrR family transcriptional regulator
MAKKPGAAAKKSGNGKRDPGEQRTSQPGTSQPGTSRHVIDTALTLAAEKGWRDLALADIAQAAGMSLAELYGLHPSKQEILDAFRRGVDREVLAETEVPEGSAKDRLFDVLMRRLDKLEPHKAGLVRIGEDSARDPLAVICGLGRLEHSMAAMLEAAGISAGGLRGALRTKGLSAVYLSTLRTWFRDETADKSKTMAALDKALGRADRLASRFHRPEKRSAAS